MNSDEQAFFNAITNMSKSMAKLADEVKAIREALAFGQRERLRESRRQHLQQRTLVNESGGAKRPMQRAKAPTRDEMLGQIRSIRNGDALG